MMSAVAAYLFLGAGGYAPPDLSNACADNPQLFNARLLENAEVTSLLRTHPNPEMRYTGASTSFVMSGPCVRTLGTVALGMVVANGRPVGLSMPPFALVRLPSAERFSAVIIPAPMNAELKSIDGSNVGSRRRLTYAGSAFVTSRRRIGLWRNKSVSAVETITCERDDKCADPIPLMSTKHRIMEIGYMSSPDSRNSGELRLWIQDDPARAYSLRLGLSG